MKMVRGLPTVSIGKVARMLLLTRCSFARGGRETFDLVRGLISVCCSVHSCLCMHTFVNSNRLVG